MDLKANVVWTRELVKAVIDNSDSAVIQALCRLTNRQLEDEKRRRSSIYVNKRGFRKQHGCLVVYAERVWAGEWLSKDDITFLRRRMKIYAGQLARMANERQLTLPAVN